MRRAVLAATVCGVLVLGARPVAFADATREISKEELNQTVEYYPQRDRQ